MPSATDRRLPVLRQEMPAEAASPVSDRLIGLDGGDAPPDAADGLLQVGELARLTGKTVRAIHLYEDLGLLKPQDRSKGRFRLFSPDSALRVRWITKLQELGLSLSEIQELVRGQEGSGSAHFAATRLREVYVTKLAETRDKLRQLAGLEAELQASLAYLDTCDSSCVPQVPVEGCTRCNRHHGLAQAPDLVAGVRAH
jgi:MerR family transcriptional regulator, copper efflux regulator